MAKPPEASPGIIVPGIRNRVDETLDAFLSWVLAKKAARTYEWYREGLQDLLDRIPSGLMVVDLSLAMSPGRWPTNPH